MKIVLEKHTEKDNKITYYIWFDHETGLPRVLCQKHTDYNNAIKYFNEYAEILKFPKTEIIKEVKI